MKLKYIILIFCITFKAIPTVAQGDDLDLAEYYYNEGQYEQAKLYYEKIYKSNKTNRVYTNYLNTLIALDDFEEAEKLAKKKIREDSKDGIAYVQLGEVYKRFKKDDLAKEQFEIALKKLEATRSNVIRLANEYARVNEFDYALKAYQKGKAESKDGYNFSYEIANMQGNLGEFDAMTESFLDLIMEDPNYIQTVQNSLNRTLNLQENEDNVEMLKNKLLKRAQKAPEQTIYTEMLTWTFLQKKDFASAFVQAASLDKRLNENGARMMSLGEAARNSRDYETSKKAYQYVIDKGPASEYYIGAKLEKLQTMKDEVASRPGFERSAYVQLETEYKNSLDQVGRNAETALLMKELAHIDAFYLQKTDDAIALLQESIQLPGISNKNKATCKLELGDVYVFKGEIWDASLLFSQVELDFKEDVLGHEAKFRNARISYYTGDFEWAQGQLDVLKASTSKLISNDAIELSLLITDNFNMDTTTVPMQMFARADLLHYQHSYDLALITLDSIVTEFPSHSLMDEIKMLKGDIYFQQADFLTAKKFYEDIVEFHFQDITADNALFKLAEMEQYIFNDNTKAMALYERLITEFPGSLFVVEARKKFRALRGDAIN